MMRAAGQNPPSDDAMNPENLSPDEKKLRALLRETRVNSGLPTRFQESVWRRIESRETPRWFDTLAARLFRLRVALAGFAAVMLLGAVVGASAGRAQAARTAQARYISAVDPYQKTP